MSDNVAENATAAKNDEPADDSMETLQIDEEDEKNDSNEDMLGGNTLKMSDSEDDETSVASKQVASQMEEEDTNEKITTKRNKITAIIDSESDEDESRKTEDFTKTIERESRTKKKMLAIIDSESEDDNHVKQKEQQIELKSQRKKISALIDTDSEEEKSTPKKEENKTKIKKKISALIDTDSDEEEEEKEKPKKEKLEKKLKKKKKQSVDSEEEKSGQSSDEETTNKLKGIVDTDSEDELSNQEEPMKQVAPADGANDKSRKSKPMRASAKKALDEMQSIQSEQQRLHREAHINVPYHQPKPRTLKEFLNRRTINKPLALAMAGGSPMPNKKEPRRSMALRMNSDELQAYAKLMEERAKEATEFFKSESEHEEEEESEDAPLEMNENPGVLDVVEESRQTAENAVGTMEVGEVEVSSVAPETETPGEELPMQLDVPKKEPQQEMTSPIKTVIVTEIVELPKLDLATLNITPPSKPATPRITEAIRRLKDEKCSDASPSLKGDANMVIDLETGDMFAKKPTGADDLLQRLMKTREAKKHKTTETVNILSTAHGKLELSKVSIHKHEEEIIEEQKPGEAYMKMQKKLKSLITKKRMDELRKKQAEDMEGQQEEDDEMDLDDEYEPDQKPVKSQVTINEDEEIVDEEAAAENEEELDEEAPDEEQLEADTEAEVKPRDVEATENSGSDEEEEEVEEETEDQPQTTKRKNRIIQAFQDDNSDEDDLDLLQTPKPSKTAPLTATQLQLSAHKLFDTEIERTASDEENELLGLCSGNFTPSLMSSAATTDGALISQIPITQVPASSQAPEELEALCSGTFETQVLPEAAPATTKILSSEEEPAEEAKAEKSRQKKLTKKRQKKKAKLGFSDDEESNEEEELGEEEEEMEDGFAVPAEEVPESFIDYDSEENEVVVQMTKKDRKLRAANFMENEAELSESDWGSADEDEKNMDNYDIELGDEDHFDKVKLQRELGQIHARKMLDQDIREVRQIQDMLFEDEEGAVRQRQFRWKNAENGIGFSLDDSRNENADGDANEGSGDEENEHLWRKIRYEREQLLQEKGLKGETAGSGSPLTPVVGNAQGSASNVRKFTIITSKKTTAEVKKNSPFLISKSISTTQQQSVRGSFLVRDKATLTKLAGLTKGASGDVDGTAGTVSVKTGKAKNFVFATLTEEEHESQKRKAADLLNSSSETGVNFMKKPRLEPRRDKCLIDQLL